MDISALRRRAGYHRCTWQELRQQGLEGDQGDVGKNFSHFIAHYFTFFSPSIHNDCLHRVYMQDFFRVEPEYEEQANHIFGTKCVKSIKDMHYEARIQAIINYKAQYEHVKIHKDVARDTTLTKEQFMLVSNINFLVV